MVLSEAKEDRVIDDPTFGSRQQDILALAEGAFLHVPGGEQLHELESIRAIDLDLALHADVPQSHMVHEMPILVDRVRVEARHEHVVVEVVRPNAVLGGPMEVRRLLDPCCLPESRENRTRVVVRRFRQFTFARVAGYHTTS